MTNQVDPAPFLPESPIYDKVVKQDGTLQDQWVNWTNSVSRTIGYAVVHDRFFDPLSSPIISQETPVNRVVPMTEAQRDILQNAYDGSIIYNLTTNRFNFRENGNWVTFTAVRA